MMPEARFPRRTLLGSSSNKRTATIRPRTYRYAGVGIWVSENGSGFPRMGLVGNWVNREGVGQFVGLVGGPATDPHVTRPEA